MPSGAPVGNNFAMGGGGTGNGNAFGGNAFGSTPGGGGMMNGGQGGMGGSQQGGMGGGFPSSMSGGPPGGLGGAPQGAWGGGAAGFGGGGGGGNGGGGSFGAYPPRRRLMSVEDQYPGSAPVPAHGAYGSVAYQPTTAAAAQAQSGPWQQQPAPVAAPAAAVPSSAAPAQWPSANSAVPPSSAAPQASPQQQQPQAMGSIAAPAAAVGTFAQAPGLYLQTPPVLPTSSVAQAVGGARTGAAMAPLGQAPQAAVGYGGLATVPPVDTRRGAAQGGDLGAAGAGAQALPDAASAGTAPFAQMSSMQLPGSYGSAAPAEGAVAPATAQGPEVATSAIGPVSSRPGAPSPSMDAQAQAQAYAQAQTQLLSGAQVASAPAGPYGGGMPTDRGAASMPTYGAGAGAFPPLADGGSGVAGGAGLDSASSETGVAGQKGSISAFGGESPPPYGAQPGAGASLRMPGANMAPPTAGTYGHSLPPVGPSTPGAVGVDSGMASRAASYNAAAETLAAVVPGLASDGAPVVRSLDPAVPLEAGSAYGATPPSAADAPGSCVHNATHCSCAMQQASLPYSAGGGDCLYVEDPSSFPMGCIRGACSGHYACTCDAPSSVNRLLCGRRLATSILVPVDAARGPIGTTPNGQSVVPCRRAALEGEGILVLEPVSV